jgi:uncharacterized protein YjbJ (UPF0337 family)
MQDVLVGSWNQLREPIKVWWNKLTDGDLHRINGNYESLVSVLQEKYGYSAQQAGAQVQQRLAEYERGHRSLTGPSSQE